MDKIGNYQEPDEPAVGRDHAVQVEPSHWGQENRQMLVIRSMNLLMLIQVRCYGHLQNIVQSWGSNKITLTLFNCCEWLGNNIDTVSPHVN